MSGFVWDKERKEFLESINEDFVRKDMKLYSIISKYVVAVLLEEDGEDLQLQVGKYHLGVTHVDP